MLLLPIFTQLFHCIAIPCRFFDKQYIVIIVSVFCIMIVVIVHVCTKCQCFIIMLMSIHSLYFLPNASLFVFRLKNYII